MDIIEQACEALVQNSPDGEPLPGTVELLCEVLKRPNPMRQGAAAWSLGFLGRKSASAVPLLLSTLDDFSNDSRLSRGDQSGIMAQALALICKGTPDEDQVVPSLARAWKAADAFHKPTFTQALQIIGPKSEQVVPELRQMPRVNGPPRIGRGVSPRSFLEKAYKSE